MGFFDFLKPKSKEKDDIIKIPTNDDVEIKDISPSKDIASFFEGFTISENIRNLLWIADGKYQNYNPDADKIFENELFRIEFSGSTEPSLLYSNLPIDPKTKIDPKESIGYFPTYERLSPGQRWIYLNWLHDMSKSVDIGYVFIFYYGLERHLVYGNYENAVDTILSLREYHENSSLNSYSSNALLMCAILYKDTTTLLKTLNDVEVVNYHGNLLLIAKYLMKLGLSPKEIISLSSAVGFKNKRYIKKYPDLFSKKVSSIIESEFGSDTLPFYNLDATFEPKEHLVFANTSFSSEIRSPILPSIIDNDDFKTTVSKILSNAHESIKDDLAKMRKEGINPVSVELCQQGLVSIEGGFDSICPYCGKKLDSMPKRKKKCPHCNKDIYVRSKQNLFPSNLLTKEDTMAVDCVTRLEISGKEFRSKKTELETKFKGNVKSTDVVWGLFNELIAKTTDYHCLKMTYFDMALFLHESGQDFFKELQQSAKMDLMGYMEGGVEKVEIRMSTDSCDTCKQSDDNTYTIKEALKTMPIPCKECTHQIRVDGKPGWCRCTYVPVIE